MSFSGPGIDDLLAEVNKQLSYKIRGEFNNKFRQQVIILYVCYFDLKNIFSAHIGHVRASWTRLL